MFSLGMWDEARVARVWTSTSTWLGHKKVRNLHLLIIHQCDKCDMGPENGVKLFFSNFRPVACVCFKFYTKVDFGLHEFPFYGPRIELCFRHPSRGARRREEDCLSCFMSPLYCVDVERFWLNIAVDGYVGKEQNNFSLWNSFLFFVRARTMSHRMRKKILGVFWRAGKLLEKYFSTFNGKFSCFFIFHVFCW